MYHRKLSILIFFCLCGALFLFPAGGSARIAGDCDACHAKFPGMMEAAEPGAPLKFALQNRLCVNCHTNTSREPVKTLGGVEVPVVLNLVAPNRQLAGGNFYFVAGNTGGHKGHNVDAVSSPDTRNTGLPPGYDRQSDPSLIGYNPGKPLACSGSNGCHGDRNIEDPFRAILGTHHAEDTPVDGSTTAKSYRYLKMTAKVKGVTGDEESRWEIDRSPAKHNEYAPAITQLCRSCHGNYHGKENTGADSPWMKHPTDIPLPKQGEYVLYNPAVEPPPDKPGTRVYSFDAPLARVSPDARGATVMPGSDQVMCLSCHVAHAGQHESSLRWDYDAVIAGEAGTGACFTCHTNKGE